MCLTYYDLDYHDPKQNISSIMAIQNLTLFSPIYARSYSLDFGFKDFLFYNFNLFDFYIYINKNKIIISIKQKEPRLETVNKIIHNPGYIQEDTYKALEVINTTIIEKEKEEIYVISHAAGGLYAKQLITTILAEKNPWNIMISPEKEISKNSEYEKDLIVVNTLDPNYKNYKGKKNVVTIKCKNEMNLLVSSKIYNSLEFYILSVLP